MIWAKHRPLDHYHVEEPLSIQAADPTYSSGVYAVSESRRMAQSQEL
jgi:hypothetical protein